MAVVRVGREKDLAALVSSVTVAHTSRAARQRLETQVLALNAGLDPARLVPGGIVVFPNSPELRREAIEQPFDVLRDTVAKQVKAWEDAMAAATEKAQADRTAMGRTARSKALRDAIGKDRKLQKQLDSIAEQATKDNAAARAEARRRAARVARWTDDLAALRRLD